MDNATILQARLIGIHDGGISLVMRFGIPVFKYEGWHAVAYLDAKTEKIALESMKITREPNSECLHAVGEGPFRDSTIGRFQRVEEVKKEFYALNSDKTYRVGNPMVYGFIFTSNDLFIGTMEIIASELERRISEFEGENFKYRRMEVERFIEKSRISMPK